MKYCSLFRVLFRSCPRTTCALLLGAALAAWTIPARASDFDGFPAINIMQPGRPSFDVLTSDRVTGLLRPDWTRAMADVGAWPAMVEFKGNIFLEFQSTNGHLGTNGSGANGATGELIRYESSDQGKTWTSLPAFPFGTQEGEFVVKGDTLYRYQFNSATHFTEVRTSTDGVNFSAPQNVYEAPYWFWGVTYDPATSMFWAAPHAITDDAAQRQVRLLNSTDGLNWNYVSTLHGPGDSESETAIKRLADGTMVAFVRKKSEDRDPWFVEGSPPYTSWTEAKLTQHLSSQHFFEIGGETFLAARTYLDPSLALPGLQDNSGAAGDPSMPYSIIYKFTDDYQLIPWAILDSMGDNGYPFLIETPTQVLVSYYSAHQDKIDKPFLAAFDKQTFLAGPVPEPAAISLMGVGGAAAGAGIYIHRRRVRHFTSPQSLLK